MNNDMLPREESYLGEEYDLSGKIRPRFSSYRHYIWQILIAIITVPTLLFAFFMAGRLSEQPQVTQIIVNKGLIAVPTQSQIVLLRFPTIVPTPMPT